MDWKRRKRKEEDANNQKVREGDGGVNTIDTLDEDE